MTNLEVGGEVAYVEWESKCMECWENAPVGNPPQFNSDGRSLRQKIIGLGGRYGNGFILGPFFFDDNVKGMSYLDILNEEILPVNLTIWILWWNQDGVPVHCFREINHCLEEVF